eukprot:4061872-Pyramimonas_sp.AAC.1
MIETDGYTPPAPLHHPPFSFTSTYVVIVYSGFTLHLPQPSSILTCTLHLSPVTRSRWVVPHP